MNRCLGSLLVSSIICNCVGYDWKPGFHITPERGWLNDPHPAFSRGNLEIKIYSKQTDCECGTFQILEDCIMSSTSAT